MPSVSATGEGIDETARAVAQLIDEAGGRSEIVPTPGHPVVLGELPGPPGAARLVRYGMYDVQPATEPGWSVPPFAAEIKDVADVGPSVVGRGAANSKGSLAAFFCALDALREDGGVPVGIAFVVEGEEELGSPNLPAVVRDRAGDLVGDAGVDFDLYGDGRGCADLILGCKGLLGLELRCAAGDWGGPVTPLHSSEAAWIASPVWAVVHALAALVGPGEELLVPALRDDVAGPTATDTELIAELADGFDPETHLRDAEAARFKLEGDTAELLEALIFRPTVNIDGIEAGDTGDGRTILPSDARAVLDVRLVPDLDADEVAAAIRAHLVERGLGFVEVVPRERYPWGKADPRSRVAAAMRRSYERMGTRPLPYPMAPWCAPFHVFDRILGIPWASGGLGRSGRAHAADEYASVEGLRQHIVGVAGFLRAFAEAE